MFAQRQQYSEATDITPDIIFHSRACQIPYVSYSKTQIENPQLLPKLQVLQNCEFSNFFKNQISAKKYCAQRGLNPRLQISLKMQLREIYLNIHL